MPPAGNDRSPAVATRRRRREVFGYCMFDFANSSYTTLISTVAFSVYFSQVVVGTGASNRSDVLWSLTTSGAHLLLILTAPILGAIADFSGSKKRFLLISAVQTVVACALLATVGPGDVALAIVLYVIGTLGFEGGYIFYNAFLREISTPRTIGRISALSWGTGFLGGLVALVACAPLLTPLVSESGALNMDAVGNYRLSFVVVAAFFAVFSVPTFLFLRERSTPVPLTGLREHLTGGFRRVAGTIRDLRHHRQTAKFIIASMCTMGGVETVIKFSAIYALVTFDIQGEELTRLFVFANVVAIPGTIAAGWMADRLGAKQALALWLVFWFMLLLAGALAASKSAFWMITPGVAIGMGATQSIGRAFMTQLSPPERLSEFFGFYLLSNKLGSIIGLLLFGAISWASGSQRVAIAGVAPLFLVALILLISVRPAPADPA